MNRERISYSKIIKTIIYPHKKTIFIGLILIIISRISGLILPGASKYLIDEVIQKNNFKLLKLLLIVVACAIVIQSITSFLLTRIMSVEAQRFISELRVRVQQKVLSLPILFFDNNKSGTLVSRVINDVEGVRNIVGTGLVQLIGGIITSSISLFILFTISTSLTLMVLIPVLVFGIISYFAFKKIRPVFKQRRKIEAEVTGRLTETLGGIRIVKGFNAASFEIEVFKTGVTTIFNNVKSTLTATSIIYSVATLLLGFASLAIMGIGGYKIMTNELTMGEFLSFTLYLGFMVAPIVQMSNISTQLTEAFSGLDRTEELMNMESEESNPKRKVNIGKIVGEIQFNNVCFSYQNDNPILKNVTFDVSSGQTIALVGSSGSGKSTIAGLIASFYNPNSGSILIDGIDLSTITVDSYRSQLGLVLQDDFLFEGTIKDNILFAKPKATDEELKQAIQQAYVDEFTDRFEKGINTVIGERGIKLSGGQRQRVAIARAIIANPRILILDEATSSLDSESEMLIQKSLENLTAGRTTIVIAHRLSTIKKADQILVIENGQILEKGKHDELIKSEGRYFHLFTYQSRI